MFRHLTTEEENPKYVPAREAYNKFKTPKLEKIAQLKEEISKLEE